MNKENPGVAEGVRFLSMTDQMPDCEIFINQEIYNLKELVKGKKVIDIGCGYGRNRMLVEAEGGEWVGVEPFEGGAHTVVGSAHDLPFEESSFDVAIMDSVLEHIPDVGKAFSEVSRVLKPGGVFIGYAAFMECFHEISYSHLSFKALEYYADINVMKLEKIQGGMAFGIDFHLQVLLYPLPFRIFRKPIASLIRFLLYTKSRFGYLALRFGRKLNKNEAKELADMHYKLGCLSLSNGFTHVIRKI